jgi:hypothetical protein
VSLNRKGEIRIARKAFQRLNEAEAVEVYFDKANCRIRLKPTIRAARDAFPVGKRGNHGAGGVHVGSVLNEYSIEIPETVRFHDAEFDEEGFLVLDLRTARVPAQVTNHRSRRGKAERGVAG